MITIQDAEAERDGQILDDSVAIFLADHPEPGIAHITLLDAQTGEQVCGIFPITALREALDKLGGAS